MIDSLVINRTQINQISDHLTSCLPEEGCGLIGGKNNLVHVVINTTNELHSTTRYKIPDQELLNAFILLEKNNLELVGIYHSHPKGPSFPSETDIKEFAYTEIPLIICNYCYNNWSIEVFQIINYQFMQIDLMIQ